MGLRIWGGLLLMAAALAMHSGARAQSYPDRPVRILIAFPAGGTIDTLAASSRRSSPRSGARTW